MPLPAIVLAAGASSRLGQPKQLVKIAGETLLARTLRLLRESASDPIFVVLGAHAENISSAVDLSGALVVSNLQWQQGISNSIHAGIAALEQHDPTAQAVMLLVCDQPKLSAQHLQSLFDAHARSDSPAIVASQYAGIAGIPAIFPASQFARLQALQGDTGARQLLRKPECPLITVPFAGGEVDIDNPEDLEAI